MRLLEPIATEPNQGSPVDVPEAVEATVVSVEDFAAVDEPGADAIVGEQDNALIAVGSDNMLFGDGGAGKTTLSFDLAAHIASSRTWLGFRVPQPRRVLIIENEGPRPLLRQKLRRKLAAWDGPSLDGRLMVLDKPWAAFTFADENWRTEVGRVVREQEIDVVLAGPVTRIGMDAAGTLQEVNAFMAMVNDLRHRVGRPLAVILVHHENKGGTVSGAWEGAGDTLLHVEAPGHGFTSVSVQKARWSSDAHGTRLELTWTDGEGFETRADRDLLGEILTLLSDGKWRTVDEIRKEVGASSKAVREIVGSEHADRFEMRDGENARTLGRSARSKLYQVAP